MAEIGESHEGGRHQCVDQMGGPDCDRLAACGAEAVPPGCACRNYTGYRPQVHPRQGSMVFAKHTSED